MSFDILLKKLESLPVAKIADDVVISVLSGTVTILSSATGSGKTLLVSSLIAEISEPQVGEPVVVLVPRRFLAQNAAETICEIIDCEVGTLVGYAVGRQSGDKSCWNTETKLLFATYGYAIASGLINRARLIVLDEVHETTMDLSITRALIHRRLAQGEKVKVLEMSATFDPARQSIYWSSVAKTKVFEIDGKTFGCERRHRPAGNIAEEVLELVREGRRGIFVFRPGVGEVQDTAKEIQQKAEAAQLAIDVAQIYGEMDFSERSKATQLPEDRRPKVLVGTNVIESGINFPWVDAGVTCGTGKENSIRPLTGATHLELIDLPQWRLSQQEGRVKRFCEGIFVLCSPTAREERAVSTRPEIERLALTELVLHCASFGLRTHELIFDYAPAPAKVLEAEKKLQRLGLIDSDCKLTKAGNFVSDLPVGPETGAMLWHATQIGCLPQAIGLAAVVEVGGLRKNLKFGHYLNNTSDYIDSLAALCEVRSADGSRRQVMERYNISFKRYQASCDLGRSIEDKLDCDVSFELDAAIPKLRQCILAGSLDKLYVGIYHADKVVSVSNRFQSYSIGQGACVRNVDSSWLIAGDLRTIVPRDKLKFPFIVLEKITVGTLEDIRAIAKVRPEVLTVERSFGVSGLEEHRTSKLFGEYVLGENSNEPQYAYDDDPYEEDNGTYIRRW